MKANDFKSMKNKIIAISEIDDIEERDNTLKLFMSMGFLWLQLTDKQVEEIKRTLFEYMPDKCNVHKPDADGYTMEFEYLRFK